MGKPRDDWWEEYRREQARRQRVDRPWSEYPIGTKALALMGGHWIKTERGWKWHCGDTFPTPGADAFDVILPAEQHSSSTPSQTTGETST